MRNVSDFFGDDLVVVISGDALTDIDLHGLIERHRSAGGIATLTVKEVADTHEYGVVIHDDEGRIQGFQEKPDPAEALSRLGNCGIYCFSPEIFDYFPERPFVDWAKDVFPALLESDVPFHIHPIESYWNDVGSLPELRQGTFDALEGRLEVELTGTRVEEGLTVGESTDLSGVTVVEPPAWIGEDCRIGPEVRLMGPVVIGDGCTVGEGAILRESIMFPGTELPQDAMLIGAVLGYAGIVERLRPLA